MTTNHLISNFLRLLEKLKQQSDAMLWLQLAIVPLSHVLVLIIYPSLCQFNKKM